MKQSDKYKGLVLMDREAYKDKVETILDDNENYKKKKCKNSNSTGGSEN